MVWPRRNLKSGNSLYSKGRIGDFERSRRARERVQLEGERGTIQSVRGAEVGNAGILKGSDMKNGFKGKEEVLEGDGRNTQSNVGARASSSRAELRPSVSSTLVSHSFPVRSSPNSSLTSNQTLSPKYSSTPPNSTLPPSTLLTFSLSIFDLLSLTIFLVYSLLLVISPPSTSLPSPYYTPYLSLLLSLTLTLRPTLTLTSSLVSYFHLIMGSRKRASTSFMPPSLLPPILSLMISGGISVGAYSACRWIDEDQTKGVRVGPVLLLGFIVILTVLASIVLGKLGRGVWVAREGVRRAGMGRRSRVDERARNETETMEPVDESHKENRKKALDIRSSNVSTSHIKPQVEKELVVDGNGNDESFLGLPYDQQPSRTPPNQKFNRLSLNAKASSQLLSASIFTPTPDQASYQQESTNSKATSNSKTTETSEVPSSLDPYDSHAFPSNPKDLDLPETKEVENKVEILERLDHLASSEMASVSEFRTNTENGTLNSRLQGLIQTPQIDRRSVNKSFKTVDQSFLSMNTHSDLDNSQSFSNSFSKSPSQSRTCQVPTKPERRRAAEIAYEEMLKEIRGGLSRASSKENMGLKDENTPPPVPAILSLRPESSTGRILHRDEVEGTPVVPGSWRRNENESQSREESQDEIEWGDEEWELGVARGREGSQKTSEKSVYLTPHQQNLTRHSRWRDAENDRSFNDDSIGKSNSTIGFLQDEVSLRIEMRSDVSRSDCGADGFEETRNGSLRSREEVSRDPTDESFGNMNVRGRGSFYPKGYGEVGMGLPSIKSRRNVRDRDVGDTSIEMEGEESFLPDGRDESNEEFIESKTSNQGKSQLSFLSPNQVQKPQLDERRISTSLLRIPKPSFLLNSSNPSRNLSLTLQSGRGLHKSNHGSKSWLDLAQSAHEGSMISEQNRNSGTRNVSNSLLYEKDPLGIAKTILRVSGVDFQTSSTVEDFKASKYPNRTSITRKPSENESLLQNSSIEIFKAEQGKRTPERSYEEKRYSTVVELGNEDCELLSRRETFVAFVRMGGFALSLWIPLASLERHGW